MPSIRRWNSWCPALLPVLLILCRSIYANAELEPEIASIANIAGQVKIEAYVMSLCPDAMLCESKLSKALNQVGRLVKFKTKYIATVTESGGIECMHGEKECAGNMQQLCLEHYVPDKLLSFIMCQNSVPKSVGSKIQADYCMIQEKLDDNTRATITACYSGKEGADLLRTSAEATAAKGIKKSCAEATAAKGIKKSW
eukprot:gene17625-23966_t